MKIVNFEVQEIQKNAISAVETIEETKIEFERIRNDDRQKNNIIDIALTNAKKFDINPFYEFSKKYRFNLEKHLRDVQASERDEIIEQQLMSFYRGIMNKILDRFIMDLSDIIKYMNEIILPFKILLPSNIQKCTIEDAEVLCNKFRDDLSNIDELYAKIELVKNDIATKTETDNIKDAAKFFIGKQDFLPNIIRLYKLALTVPVSVASNERSFSRLKLVKNYLRSTMKEERLDSLMLCACSIDILDQINIDSIADSWSVLKTRKVRI